MALTAQRLKKYITVSALVGAPGRTMFKIKSTDTNKTTTNGQLASQPLPTAASLPPTLVAITATH